MTERQLMKSLDNLANHALMNGKPEICLVAGYARNCIKKLRRKLKIASNLYAHHAKIDPEEAVENIRDAEAIKRGVQ